MCDASLEKQNLMKQKLVEWLTCDVCIHVVAVLGELLLLDAVEEEMANNLG